MITMVIERGSNSSTCIQPHLDHPESMSVGRTNQIGSFIKCTCLGCWMCIITVLKPNLWLVISDLPAQYYQ